MKVEAPEATRLVYNIVRDHWAFDFATHYASEHPTVPSPADFEITDTIFNEFKHFIDPEKFQYDKVCEVGLEQLRKVAKTEGYINDSTTAAFNHLETLLKHDLNHDLDIHRADISRLLAQEILDRYYYQRGQIEYSLKADECIDAIVKVMTKPNEWKRLLNLKGK